MKLLGLAKKAWAWIRDPLWNAWLWLVRKATAEGLLHRHANGGAVIAARAVWTTMVLSAILLGLFNLCRCLAEEYDCGTFCWVQFKTQLEWGAPYIVGGFGATYAGFYARFASQWTYLAGTYNQIKRAECGKEWNKKALAQWKAGYIEDAETLHLTTKSSIAPTIWAWLQDSDVASASDRHTPNGKALREEIRERVKTAIRREITKRWDEETADAYEAGEARKEREKTRWTDCSS